jgi:hypothetical protein
MVKFTEELQLCISQRKLYEQVERVKGSTEHVWRVV